MKKFLTINLLKKISFDGDINTNIDKIYAEHQDKLNEYKKIENIIEQQTKDFEITKFEDKGYSKKLKEKLYGRKNA